MVESKKRIVTFVVTAAVVCGALIMRLTKPVQSYQEEPLIAGSGSLTLTEPNFAIQPPKGLQENELYYKMILAVILVGGLGVAAIYLSKKLVPKFVRLSGKEIRITETAYIGQRKAVHLLKIGDRTLLIGSTNESITKLADVTEALGNVPEQQKDNG
jgi:flagellar biogenesis protein FliO